MAPAEQTDGPGEHDDAGNLVLREVSWAGRERAADIVIRDQRITAITPCDGPPRWFCLPPLADLHVHANRAYTPARVRPASLADAVDNVRSLLDGFTEADHQRHAQRLADQAWSRGTTVLRSHADLSAATGLRAVLGSLAAAEAIAARQRMDVIAFASSRCDPATAEGAQRLGAAIAAGAAFLGAVPAFYPDPDASIDAILDLAVRLDVPVDLHLDEHLDAGASRSEKLADATRARGLAERVTLSHGCAMAAMPEADRHRVADKLARAGITVIALPRTNLYLQDRDTPLPLRRGLAPVRELLAAGVAVRFASDNVRDAFYPFGDADLLGVAVDGMLATHLDSTVDVVAAICDGRSDFAVGDDADLVVLPGTDADAVFAAPPARRWVVQGGAISGVGLADPAG